MENKDILDNLDHAYEKVSADEQMLATLQEMMNSPKTSNLDPKYNPNRTTSAPYIKYAEMYERYMQQYERDREEYDALEAKIKVATAKLDNPHYRDVIELRHIARFHWRDIAKQFHYSERWIYVIYARARAELDKVMKAEKSAG